MIGFKSTLVIFFLSSLLVWDAADARLNGDAISSGDEEERSRSSSSRIVLKRTRVSDQGYNSIQKPQGKIRGDGNSIDLTQRRQLGKGKGKGKGSSDDCSSGKGKGGKGNSGKSGKSSKRERQLSLSSRQLAPRQLSSKKSSGKGGSTGKSSSSVSSCDEHDDEFVYSFSYSFVYSFSYSFVYSFSYSFVYSFTYSFVYSFVYSFSYEIDETPSSAPSDAPSAEIAAAQTIHFIGTHPDDYESGTKNITLIDDENSAVTVDVLNFTSTTPYDNNVTSLEMDNTTETFNMSVSEDANSTEPLNVTTATAEESTLSAAQAVNSSEGI